MINDSKIEANFKSGEEPQNINIRFRNDPGLLTDVCFFSSYSFAGVVEDYVYYYLNALKNAGFLIVFITPSHLNEPCVHRLAEYAFLILERENKCPDFGSWKLGLSLVNWGDGFNSVLLANDSVFGPFYDLSGIISVMKKRFDVWGMTDSYEIDYHLQSYFLYFNKNAVSTQTWLSFWKNVDGSLSKQEVINRYEVGLSQSFLKANFRVAAYASVDIIYKSARHDHRCINPSLGFWRILIEQYEFPFLKREALIKLDIHKVYWQRGLYINVGNWRKLIDEKTQYPVKYIDDFLDNYYQYIKKENKDIVIGKRKILFLSHNVEIGGAQRVLLNFLKWLKEKTSIPFETIICKSGKHQLVNEFSALGNIVFFNSLSDFEKQRLKDRLVDEQIALVFSNTMVNVEVLQFLSFLDVPQIIFVHELSHVLNTFSFITDNIEWLRNNISHFIGCSAIVRDNLVDFLKIEKEKTSVIYEFINQEDRILDDNKANDVRTTLKIPPDAFIVGMSGTFEWRKSADLLPVIATSLHSKYQDIHLVWLGADADSQLYDGIVSDIEKSGLSSNVHLVNKTNDSAPFFQLFDIFLMISREDPFPLVNLESGAAGKPVICFKNSGGSEEYVSLGAGHAVPYFDVEGLVGKVLNYYEDRTLLQKESAKISSIVKNNFVTEVQAPKVLEVIARYYDEKEVMLTEQPVITIMTHVFFDGTWEEIKTHIKHFDNGLNYFLFNVSEVCLFKEEIVKDIKSSFTNAFVIVSSNVGRDIGAKFALIDLYLLLGINSSYIVFLHDKQSLHTLVGESWKTHLFRVIDPNYYRTILNIFKDNQVGVVGAKEHFINEYDDETGVFRHNHDLTKILLNRYNISIKNYEYISGTIYWLRSAIIERFFKENSPISLRTELESGNILDLKGGTMVHTWERMFCWMATNYGYSIKGI